MLPFSIGRGKMVGGADEKLNNIVPLINKNFGIFLLLRSLLFYEMNEKKESEQMKLFLKGRQKERMGPPGSFGKSLKKKKEEEERETKMFF